MQHQPPYTWTFKKYRSRRMQASATARCQRNNQHMAVAMQAVLVVPSASKMQLGMPTAKANTEGHSAHAAGVSSGARSRASGIQTVGSFASRSVVAWRTTRAESMGNTSHQ